MYIDISTFKLIYTHFNYFCWFNKAIVMSLLNTNFCINAYILLYFLTFVIFSNIKRYFFKYVVIVMIP